MKFVSLFLPECTVLACQYKSSLSFVSLYFVVSKAHYINETWTAYRINVHYFVIQRSDFTTKLFAPPPFPPPSPSTSANSENVDPSCSCYVWQHVISVAMLFELQRWETARRNTSLHFKLLMYVCVCVCVTKWQIWRFKMAAWHSRIWSERLRFNGFSRQHIYVFILGELSKVPSKGYVIS